MLCCLCKLKIAIVFGILHWVVGFRKFSFLFFLQERLRHPVVCWLRRKSSFWRAWLAKYISFLFAIYVWSRFSIIYGYASHWLLSRNGRWVLGCTWCISSIDIGLDFNSLASAYLVIRRYWNQKSLLIFWSKSQQEE